MNQLLKAAIVLILMVISSVELQAQYMNLGTATQEEFKPQRWFVGGMLGGSFSGYGGSFEIAPIVGYKVTPEFHVGTRITYIYSSFKYNSNSTRYHLNDYGASLFARYQFYKPLFGHVEYEALSLELPPYAVAPGESVRMLLNSLFVGGGIIQPLGGRGFATIAILFNLLENEYSSYVYSNPIIRVGFGVGL
ncbi:MAG: hypothetical protein A2W85_11705 [Bacteroidetes bacterium GWF2_41_31]|nr:MAG: hypothetical protein A2W85_11705 [Bacteroidetes bacterium GWF2_41_31]